MNSLRRWLYRPKRSDSSLLAQFYFADEDLNMVAAELDSFEGRKDPERCTALVNQLRACQARVLNVVSQMMDEQVKEKRAPRDFRVKFPDDVIQENLAGQLWFGAECLAAGSSIMNREVESACMRPLARALTKNLDSLRNILREQCLRSVHEYTDEIKESLVIFDKLFAEFELSYVSAMVPVKTAHEYDMVQEITVLFSETVQRALKIGLLSRDMIDEYDPALMFTIPRLAIISGVHIFKDGPLNPDNDPWNLSEMFRPFQTLLLKIRELLGILTEEELNTLERALCSQDEPSFLISLEEKKQNVREERRRSREERKPKSATVKNRMDKDESDDGSIENELTALEIAERLEALALSFESSRNAKLTQSEVRIDHETESKSSDTASTSTSSLTSEADVEDGNSADAAKESGSDHADDAQVQHITNQLYNEADVDNFHMTRDLSTGASHSAFPPEYTDPPPHNPTSESRAEDGTSDTNNSVSLITTVHNHSESDNNLESAVIDRARFAMNKCDSSDSGLHSEVLSSSGSTFTISSSDSNQQVAISDAPVTSDCLDDHRGHSQPPCVQTAENMHITSIKQDAARVSSVEDAYVESKQSIDMLVSEPEVKNTELCNDSSSGCTGEQTGPVIPHSRKDKSLHENDGQQPHKLASANQVIEYPDDALRQPNETTAVPDFCSENLSSISNTVPQIFTHQLGSLSGTLMQEEALCCVEESVDNHTKEEQHSQLLRDHEIVDATITPETIHGITDRLQISRDPTCGNSSHAVIVDAGSGDPQRKCSVNDSFCDNGKNKQYVVDSDLPVNDLTVVNGETSAEDSTLKCSSKSLYPIDSVHAVASSSSDSISEDRENNNDDVRKCALQSQAIEVSNISDACTAQSYTSQVCGQQNARHTGTGETEAEQKSEILHSTPSQSPFISNAINDFTATSAANSSDLSHLVNVAVTEVSQDSGKLASIPPPPLSHDRISSHSHVVISADPSSSAPDTSSAKSNYNGVKGTSKPRAFKKGSKVRQQRETTSRQGQKPGLPSQAKTLMETHLLDNECNHSSETSSYTSECGDQEEIDLAIKAAESATRHQVRARFQSSSDMIHRLFVCVSGVADQLQTNYAGDLRNILRAVFDMNCSEPIDINTEDKRKDATPLEAAYRAMSHASRTARRARNSMNQKQEPPSWIPDEQSNECMSCQVPFTFVRRRHHCRNCGKIFCSRCSSNFVPLPHFGQEKAVRVCNRCFMFQVTPFTVRSASQ